MAALIDILGWRNISTSIQVVEPGVPNNLPPAMLSIKEPVLGDRTTWINFYGQRQTPQQVPYGSPSRKVEQRPMGEKSVALVHFNEHIMIEAELLARLRNPNDLTAQIKAREVIARAGSDFKERFTNGRISAATLALANAGILWYDANGGLLNSSSGAALTIDPGVHANNQNQLNGIIDASWATTTTNIMTHLTKIKKQAILNTGRRIKHAFYGVNIPQYLFTNATLSKYWQFYPKMYEAFTANPGEIPNGFAGLEWHPMYESFYNNQSDSQQVIWGDDNITFTPEFDKSTYTMFEGSLTVPKLGYGPVQGDLMAMWNNTEDVYGMGGYGIPVLDPTGFKMIYFDTYLPALKTAAVNGTDPGDYFFADTTP